MTSCMGETWHDWGIRVRPGDGRGKRPQKEGDPLPPFGHGRANSSSSAELREEVAGASSYSCTSATGWSKPNKDQTLT